MLVWLQLEVRDMFWFTRHRVHDLHRNKLLATVINDVRNDVPNRLQPDREPL
jgi:hypothetical protein